MAIDWNQYYQMAANTATNDINPDSGQPYMTNTAGFGADDYLHQNNITRSGGAGAPLTDPAIAAILAQKGFPATTEGAMTYQYGPGQAIQGPNGDWFWQTTGPIGTPKDWGIADQQNSGWSDIVGKGIVGLTLAGFGSGLTGLASGGAAGGAGASGGGSMFSDLPSWAGGAPEGLGGGAAGAGLGGAAAPAIGTAAGSGLDAAGGGMFSNLPGWAGGAGGTSAGGGTDILQQLQQLGVSPQQAAQIVQQMGGGQQGVTGQGGQQSGLQSLLPFLGIGSGLNTLLGNQSNAVDPNRINSLWQAGQNTYNTSLDPQNALYNQTAQQVQDQARAADSARGIGMGGVSAGNENDAMRKFNIDWQNQQLARQATGTQAFAQAGNVGANAGIANNAQAFMQNQTGLNNLTTGLQGLFGGSSGGGTAGNAGGNAIGSWLNGLFSGGSSGGQAGGGSYQPFNGAQSYNSQGTYQPYYTGYDSAGGPAYG